ncbi:UvrD-helicase domain-containing protein [Vibrio sp. NC2]|uniref:UvrD-helicase domain-containing protein n=1 Tax=Vibrio sp. NC2 TaxID=2974562 RepID=UPI0021A96F53|nr:UvrD-helicase domain-containing protein [Vibrio sp. NC2]MCT4348329.1 UvrD-helicase domain-containing protein [Vibrio sp. NC2]
MSLSIISDLNKDSEQSIQESVNECLSNNVSFVFDSGAGSGKTYSLISSLMYVLKSNRKKLSSNSQKIKCITYTNVAANEIKVRLGETSLIDVSTIHEMLWGFISLYNKQLVDIHLLRLRREIKKLSEILNKKHREKKNTIYLELEDNVRREFVDFTLSKKDIYYENYGVSANKFRESLGDELFKFGKMYKNVTNLKFIMGCIYKMDNFEKCIASIKSKEENFDKIKYNSSNNKDSLHKMVISHDTVIDYAYSLFKKYPLVSKVFFDIYPCVLIDEYQDTNPKVIKIMAIVDSLAKDKGGVFVVGYFGDKYQNIYDDGVGGNILNSHPNLNVIRKVFNRRSNQEIINVINSFRKDDIDQKSIFSDCEGGSVKFYQSNSQLDKLYVVKSFIDEYVKSWCISGDDKIHCLVLTNKILASLSGFSGIYGFFSTSGYYSKYYDRINVELLNSNLTKLGKSQTLLYRVVELRRMLMTKSNINRLLDNEMIDNFSYKQLSDLFKVLKSFNFKNVNDYLKQLFLHYQKSSSVFRRYVDSLFKMEDLSYEKIINYLVTSLNPDLSDDEQFRIKRSELIAFLELDIKEFDRWYEYVSGEVESNVVYHTYHGTKGVEFDNVIVIMENDFGLRDRNKFSKYFSDINPDLSSLNFNEIKKFENTRNLLYVSCSRAVKNLRVLYLDDVSQFEEGIVSVFSKVDHYAPVTHA